MKIERVVVEGFGTLADYDTGADPLGRLVVVFGPNEAGKSTLFHFLTTQLYGFRPAARESNPYVPWGSEEAAGRVELSLDGGGCVRVERRLRAQPGGRLVVDGRADELRNRALPWVDHIPRAVFSQVFAIRLAELAGLDGETWGRVQDRMLGSMGASDLLPAREIAAELEREAGELWRPHRRGHQRVRDLQREMREMRGTRRDAIERDRRIREAVEERDRLRARIDALRDERTGARASLERIRELQPVRRQLRRIEALRRAAGPEPELLGLPARPAERLEELCRRQDALDRRRGELEEDTAEPRAAARALGERERELLRRAAEARAMVGRLSEAAPARVRAAALREEIEETERRLGAAAADVLTVPWSQAPVDRLLTVPLPELETHVRRAEREREDRRVRELASAHGPSGRAASDRTPWLVGGAMATLAGGLLVESGFGTGRPFLGVVGALVALGGLALLVRGFPRADSRAREPVPHAAADSAHDAVRRMVSGLPLAAPLLEEPDSRLVLAIQRLQEALRGRAEALRARTELEERLSVLDRDAGALAASLGVAGGGGAGALASILERELARAERIAEAAAGAERELGRLDRERRRVEEEARTVEEALESLRERLRALGAGDLEAGTKAAEERMAAHRRSIELMEELERERPDLEDLRERIARAEAAGETWTGDGDEAAVHSARIERIGEEIEELARSAERLDADVSSLRELGTIDDVDGRVAGLGDEAERLVRLRDRRWVMACMLREADRRFREEHQPDLMRRAGSYLEHLTDGRYQRIVTDELGEADVFRLVGRALPGPMALAAPLSTGTLEQAYLALRLAIVDHLDQGGERLPLFIDEVFVNWDAERRGRGIDLVTSLARTRQVFVFTCHADVADELERRGGARLTL